ncbi:MAG: peptide chain release factor N(5)-glutamine methyltransferase [Chloroflexota bacterium]
MDKNQRIPDRTKTISSSLAAAKQQLSELSDTPEIDARVLLAHICKKDQSWLFAHPESHLTGAQVSDYEASLKKVSGGMPLPYVVGKWEFYGLSFKVTPDVLIPRPETELLVETALDWLQRHPEKKRVVEAGTGSGCIAISLAAHNPKLEITATDISAAALQIAMGNAEMHQVSSQIKFQENDLLSNFPGQFDLICANLPYIPTETLQELAVYKREPTLALDGGADGLDLVRRLLDQGVSRLVEGGLILLEIEDQQGEDAALFAGEKFPGAEVTVKSDLAGKPRLLVIAQ